VGRGTTVDQDTLIAALKSGHLNTAYLNVMEPEPLPPAHPLWSAPNLTVTPHVAGQLDPAHVVAQFLEEVGRLERGEPLRRPVDPARGY
ncbi:MAG TPA: NAD(P)-dependent oxidoreductase, partial [Burkholderiaceae bacterium]|nr:NAD(P)-dependent oxidoreductase [Burkholderiaceae bacterium]